jgi:anti-sigma regulatory factor (Ser/Thr protein kinase)
MPDHASTRIVRDFITRNLGRYPSEIVRVAARHFKMTRQAVNRHLKEMEADGLIEGRGNTRSRTYRLCPIAEFEQTYPVADGLEEHVPWLNDFKPRLRGIPDNIMEICSYGFTEIFNNAVDHSQGEEVTASMEYTADSVDFRIADSGVGIFRKIKNHHALNDEIEAVWELSKGKLTTDPVGHSGEGIFFTARMFDRVSILSVTLLYAHRQADSEWHIEQQSHETPGTTVTMNIGLKSKTKMRDVFDHYADEDNQQAISKTRVPVKLLQHGLGHLVSRSQAKRLLARLNEFSEVQLDFSGVESVGQGFVDEVFRVFRQSHPNVQLVPVAANNHVERVISRAINRDN